jgi:DNA-binding response OmpR family regulator
MGTSIQRPIARFEDFEVHLETGEVWKAGRPLKVQDQPFKVLAALYRPDRRRKAFATHPE